MSAPMTPMTPMTPITSPRVAERLLETLGAEPDFRDALLGDMAEELAIRAAWDGERAARRWYRREALRVAPHLLRDGVRRLRWRDVRRLAGIVLSAYVLATAIAFPLGVLVVRLTAPASAGAPPAGALSILLAIGVASAVLGGWLAATLDDESPVLAALTLAVVVPTAGLVVAMVVGPASVALIAVGLARTVLLAAATALGGVLRVWRAARR